MTPYFILLFLVVMIAYFARVYGSVTIRRISIGLIVLLLALFAGLRDRSVGTDTGTYINHFLRINPSDDIWRTSEIGYNALMVFCGSLSGSYTVLLTAIALIVVGCYVTTIVRVNKRYETALFLFVSLGVYTFFFNGARQGIATALCFLALPWLLNRRPMPYFVLVGVAALFHHTALIAAPLYFLAFPRLGWRQPVIVIVGAIVMAISLSVFVSLAAQLLGDKYLAYADEGEGGGRIMAAFLVMQGIMFFLFRYRVDDSSGNYTRLLNIYMFGLIPVLAATISNVNPSGLLRLHIYFSHTAVLLWPMVFFNFRHIAIRGLVAMAFLTIVLMFFTLTISSFSNLVPYQINSEFSR